MSTSTDKFSGFAKRLMKRLLRLRYRFAGWHILNFEDRDYSEHLLSEVEELSSRHAKSILDIGCGLGSLLRRCSIRRRVGLDIDCAAIRAARLIARIVVRANIDFQCADVIGQRPQFSERFDVIVVVNWVDKLPTLEVLALLEYCKNHLLRSGGTILIDSVTESINRRFHDIPLYAQSLRFSSRLCSSTGNGRNLWALSAPGHEIFPEPN